ncbi:aldehyde dehydrogenase (NADP(+)) [Glycomyces harbinensis]|uniref:NADP-dependent aldehyde dehydrogenase n=1 Tax=Glycomyces harbinensis TaxID=58114 RepID=A0A1G6XD35_9ACTN|nr:aldehyde dehydrogenase (NADP(+)) [Glycomyces harbinensis]SDD75981.1 NADP-dependent aldehyde dehydrogenase [Glycomyces harbinensis]
MTAFPELDLAAARAEAAFDEYRSTDPTARAAFLDAIAAGIEALGDRLVDTVAAETRFPAARAASERARTCGQLRMFARLVESGDWQGVRVEPALPDRTPPRPDLRLRRIPLGPVAVFGASNFPLAFSVAGGDTAAALAAGAPVIVKAHEAHAETSALVGEAIRAAVAAAGLPEGVFGLLFGPGRTLGQALVAHRAIKAVGFTGSRAAGLAIAATAAARPEPIPVYAEMSSVNPVFVLPGALAARPAELARGLVASATLGAGQFCTNPGLVFIPESDGRDAFLDTAAADLEASAAQPMLTPAIRESYLEGVERLAAVPGVRVLARGGGDPAPALLHTDGATFLAEPSLREEVFGSATLIVTAGPAELDAILDALEGQLTATVQASPDDRAAAARLLPRLELMAGRIVFGGWPTGVEVGPATVHGGPFPATTDSRSTSVGTLAIDRFLRPVAYQDAPAELLPPELR